MKGIDKMEVLAYSLIYSEGLCDTEFQPNIFYCKFFILFTKVTIKRTKKKNSSVLVNCEIQGKYFDFWLSHFIVIILSYRSF